VVEGRGFTHPAVTKVIGSSRQQVRCRVIFAHSVGSPPLTKESLFDGDIKNLSAPEEGDEELAVEKERSAVSP
jgi:hypothetical protein